MPSSPEAALDFPFTENDTPELRARISRDLRHVAARAHGLDPHLHALVLTGGFSRGEGTSRDGAPVNDYDVLAIRRRPGGGARYRRLAADLHREIDLEVDLMPVWERRLPHVGRKLFWLDIRLGARVVTGPVDVLARVRRFAPGAVTAAERARLLGNRAAGMLLSIPAPGEPDDARQRDLQATKAVLAAMDATLLCHGQYAAKLRDRLDLTRGHPDHAAFRHAAEWKLRPHHALPDGWWETARDTLLRAVATTRARDARDGIVEHVLHVGKAHRLRYSPSQAVRCAAWDILAISTYPDGPADILSAGAIVRKLGAASGSSWEALKRGFFLARARTLQ